MAKYTVNGVAFIGRTFDEYCRMFDLSEQDLLTHSFLDCPAGACSFTAEATQKGYDVQAVDCQYGHPASFFENTCHKQVTKIKAGMSGAEHLFDWSFYGTLDQLLALRQKAAHLFVTHIQTHSSLKVGNEELEISEEQASGYGDFYVHFGME